MADLIWDDADVLFVDGTEMSGLRMRDGHAAVAGQLVFQNADRTLEMASNATLGAARVYGVVLNSAAPGQPVAVAFGGSRVHYGANVVPGQIYCAGEGGAIIPAEDLGDGMYVTVIGIGQDDGIMLLGFIASGIALED